jgi:hypothetical protein
MPDPETIIKPGQFSMEIPGQISAEIGSLPKAAVLRHRNRPP